MRKDCWIIETGFNINMAHHLTGHNGKCQRFHGHGYQVQVKVKGNSLLNDKSSQGMVIDFTDIKKLNKVVEDLLDHKVILQAGDATIDNFTVDEIIVVTYRTTTENIAKMIYGIYEDLLKKYNNIEIDEVVISETPNNKLTYKVTD
jgi:6-pyruvoyltetrahydropterin/6-carboxytetrahydropterin synthase